MALVTSLFRKGAKKQVTDAIGFVQAYLEAKTTDEKKEIDSKLTAELDDMVTKLYGPRGEESQTKELASPKEQRELAEAIVENDFFVKGIIQLPSLGFEARKRMVWVFQYVITNYKDIAVPMLLKNKKIFTALVNCYENTDTTVVVNFDNILSTCIQNKDLAEFILSDATLVNPFFKHMESPTAGMDSFPTFKLLMTEHKGIPASEYIKKHYDTFIPHYNGLLVSNNFLTKVQAFQLLNELLCARVNFDVMVKYINDPENLKLVMKALKGTKAQQTAVFHVLKIFVGNPRKSPAVASILSLNRENLVYFVQEFEKDKDDARLEKDKEAMLERLNELKEKEKEGDKEKEKQ